MEDSDFIIKIKNEQEPYKPENEANQVGAKTINLIKQENADEYVKFENEVKVEYKDLHSVIENIKADPLESIKIYFKPLEAASVPKEFKCALQLQLSDSAVRDSVEEIIKDEISTDKPHTYLKSLNSNSLLVCNVCHYKTDIKQRFKRHLSTHFEIEKIFVCDICYFKTARREYLHDHKKIHDSNNINKRFTNCPRCHRMLSAKKSNMNRHLEVCKVGLINEVTIPLTERKLPTKNKDAKKIYKCDKCDYSCAFKCGLGNHRKSHSNKILKCDHCDYTTSKLPEFSLHLLIHTGKEPYECEVCGYKAAFKQNLRRHVLKHSKVQPFICDRCLYSTYRKHYLLSHMVKHTRKK